MKIEEIAIWEAFYGVAKYGNFSKASKALQIAVPQLSKRIAKLEDRLGVRLFQRSTRIVSLTDEGKALLPKVTSLLEDWSGIESSFESSHQKLLGTIRVTCLPFIAHRLLIPILGDFMKLHPGIHVELELSEKILNLIESNIDLAIRIEEPEDTELIYRKLVPNELIFCASPRYLKNSKAPLKEPAHLHKHQMLMLDLHRECRFRDGSYKLKAFANSRKLSCENGAFLTDLALNDFGVLVRSIWDVREHLHKGELVQVLKKHPLETFGHIYAVIPSRRFLAPRVRTFLDFVVERASKWRADA
jgi:DNA-binding transcriptional LysR family regulator